MGVTLKVRLDADGEIEVESVDGRWLTLRTVRHFETWSCDATDTLKWLLREAQRGEVAIGQTGNPTHKQLRFWERNGYDWGEVGVTKYPMGKSGGQIAAASEAGRLRVSAVDLDDLL